MNLKLTTGKVILAGAGPGDPELITVKALRYLQAADIVITDRLVSKDLLEEARPEAEIIFAGKQGGEDSTAQSEINGLMVKHALQNKLVVRLKGGDVTFFSNILDELKTLIGHHIPYEIIPGVTAASGAAAYAGIPLTARGYATAVRFLTCHKPEQIGNQTWKELAATDDTLVFYMSSRLAGILAEKLTAHGIASSKYMAIVEQGTTPNQNVRLYNLYEYESEKRNTKFISPTLIIVGKVAALHENFRWMANSGSGDSYFLPVSSAKEKSATVPQQAE